jgi:hypothetical protein
MDGNGKKRSAVCEASELRRQAEQRLRRKKTKSGEAIAGGDVHSCTSTPDDYTAATLRSLRPHAKSFQSGACAARIRQNYQTDVDSPRI